MTKIIVNEPVVSGTAENAQAELTPEQKAERKEFLSLKLEDLEARIKAVKSELKGLN